MKKLSYIMKVTTLCFILHSSFFIFSSCRCDDGLEGSGKYTSSVSIISQDVCFDAPASQGMIQFSAPGSAYVYTTSDWCTASLNGNTVNVSATQNSTRISRSCDVVIKCGTDSARVNVIQKGFVFQVSAGNTILMDVDEPKAVSYAFSENLDFSLVPSEDWFTATIDGDSLRFTFAENNTGHIRKGYLYYISQAPSLPGKGGSEVAKDSLTVIQYDYAKDIAGQAYMYYKDKNGTQHYTNIVIADSYFTFPDFAQYGDWKVPFVYYPKNMQLHFTNAQDVGMYNNVYYVSDVMFGGSYYSTYKSISWDAYINYDAENRYFRADMVDNGSWTGASFEGFYLRAFNSTTYSGSTDVGSILQFFSPVIIRPDQQSSSVKALLR